MLISRLKGLLRYVNSIPFPFTTKHYFAFDQVTGRLKNKELNSAESWDTLRQDHPHFLVSENRGEWLDAAEARVKKDGQDGGLVVRSRDVIRIIERLGIESVFSVGVGGAGLEYQIKKAKPGLRMVCSEYSAKNVERLKKVFLEADSIIMFDMKNGNWNLALNGADPEKALVLLYRIDIHFTNDELKEMFRSLHDSGIKNILVILCGQLTLRGLINRLLLRIKWLLNSVPFVFAGYLRSTKTYLIFWQPYYANREIECGGLKSFLLRRRE